MKNFFSLLTTLLFSFLIAQQAPEIEWSKTYGGSDFEEAYDIKQTSDGGFIVVGYTKSNDIDVSENKGDKDYWILKLDENSIIEWEKSYGGSSRDVAYSVEFTSDGGYVIVGTSYSIDGDVGANYGEGFTPDIWLIKLNSEGDLVWNRILGGTVYENMPFIIKTQDGGFAMIASTNSNDHDISNNHGGFDYWLVKMNEFFEIEWSNTYGGSKYEGTFAFNPPSLIQTGDGHFIVAGESESNNGDVTDNFGKTDFWVFNVNNNGALIWQKSFGGSGYDMAHSIIEVSNGNFIITGLTSSKDGQISNPYGENNDDIWLISINQSGELIWEKSLGGFNIDWGVTLNETSDGNFIMGSISGSDDGDVDGNYGDLDFWMSKLNLNGDILWEKNYGGSGAELINKIEILQDEKFLAVGSSTSDDFDVPNNYGATDFWIVKLGSDQMSTHEIESTKFTLLPNPVKDILNFSEKLNQIEIYNLSGMKLMNKSDGQYINVQTLPIGTYILKAKDQKRQTITQKFIKR